MEILLMKILILIFLTSPVFASDQPVAYWSHDSPETIPRQWQPYLSPNSIQFWKEGDYTPPTPLIIAMRDPTPQNITLYKTYLKRRAGMVERFQVAMKKDQIDQIERIVIAFRSDCSACHQLLTELANYPHVADCIQLLQVDQGFISLPWPRLRISESQAQSLNIQAVPTVWVQMRNERTVRLDHPTKLFEDFL